MKKERDVIKKTKSSDGKPKKIVTLSDGTEVELLFQIPNIRSTPLGIENVKKERDESIVYTKKGITWYRANAEAEPEVLAFNGWHIINYNEFLGDINENGVPYRIFYNPVSEKFIANKIVSFDYDGEGMTLLENQANIEVSKKMEKFFLEENIAEKDWLDTASNFLQRIKSIVDKKRKERESNKKPVGNKPKTNLIKATLWCIRNHPKHLKYKRQTLLRAYKKFGDKNQIEESFIKIVGRKWSLIIREYGKESKEFIKENSLIIYAKSKLKIPRNTEKQKIKENTKTFN
jgi:hypothetical protein